MGLSFLCITVVVGVLCYCLGRHDGHQDAAQARKKIRIEWKKEDISLLRGGRN